MRTGPALLALVILTALVAARPTCAPDVAQVQRIYPGIDPELARHLAGDDDAALERCVRKLGSIRCRETIWKMKASVDPGTEPDFVRTWSAASLPI